MNPPRAAPLRYFDNLPVELLKHIVGMVKAQDEAFRTSKVEAAPVPDANYSDSDADGEIDVLLGVWNSQYGRGIAVLSRVDERFRQLTFPLLCETVNAEQLANASFRLSLIDDPTIASAIHHLDFINSDIEDLLPAISTIRSLPNIRHVSLPSENVLALDSDQHSIDEHSLSAKILLEVVRQAPHITVPSAETVSYLHVLDLSRLRRLDLAPSKDHPFDIDHLMLPAYLQRFSGLETLRLIIWTPPTPNWHLNPEQAPESPLFHDLRLLEIRGGVATQAVLEFVLASVPTLRHLRLLGVDGGLLSKDFTVDFPFLEHLHIEGHSPRVNTTISAFRHSSSLRSLSIEVSPLHILEEDDYLLSPNDLPPSLRLLTLTITGGCRPNYSSSILEAYRTRNVVSRSYFRPDLELPSPFLIERSYVVRDSTPSYHATAPGERGRR